MSNGGSFFHRWSPVFLSILRIVVGLLIFEHGTQKLFHFPPPAHAGEGPLPPLMLTGGWIESIGGALLVLGLFTRIVGFILSGEMAVAYFMFHAQGSVYPVVNHGELAVILCFVFLYFVFAGAGPWSVDHMIGGGKPRGTGSA
jgi:putative oxidoreductase